MIRQPDDWDFGFPPSDFQSLALSLFNSDRSERNFSFEADYHIPVFSNPNIFEKIRRRGGTYMTSAVRD
jgi:hypothetical protein